MNFATPPPPQAISLISSESSIHSALMWAIAHSSRVLSEEAFFSFLFPENILEGFYRRSILSVKSQFWINPLFKFIDAKNDSWKAIPIQGVFTFISNKPRKSYFENLPFMRC